MNHDNKTKRLEIEAIEKWESWIDKIPKLHFAEDWDIKIIPPYLGAMVRFVVTQKDATVSVYLDCNQMLGYADGDPYWEIYPNYDGDTQRFSIEDSKGLLAAISDSINHHIQQ